MSPAEGALGWTHTWLHCHIHVAFPVGILTFHNHLEFVQAWSQLTIEDKTL